MDTFMKRLLPCPKKRKCLYRLVHTAGHSTYFLLAAWDGRFLLSFLCFFLLGVTLLGFFIEEELL